MQMSTAPQLQDSSPVPVKREETQSNGNMWTDSEENEEDVSPNDTFKDPADLQDCIGSVKGRIIFTAWFCAYLPFLPVFLYVLGVGFAKWRKRRSSVSHSDVFTFHMALMELVSILGAGLAFFGFYGFFELAMGAGANLMVITSTGQVFFHCLICGERYMAVAHPIAYLRLKERGGVTVRNLSAGFVWLFSVGYCFVSALIDMDLLHVVLGCALSFLLLAFVSFCCVSVLCVLIRPGPGEGGWNKKKSANQWKRAAFYTMTAILGALLLRLVAMVVCHSMYLFMWLEVDECVMTMCSLWFGLPSSLVLPVLFLHRAGKLPG